MFSAPGTDITPITKATRAIKTKAILVFILFGIIFNLIRQFTIKSKLNYYNIHPEKSHYIHLKR